MQRAHRLVRSVRLPPPASWRRQVVRPSVARPGSARAVGTLNFGPAASAALLGWRLFHRSLASAANGAAIDADMEHVSVDVDTVTGVAVVEMTRHSKMNALSRAMAHDLARAVQKLDRTDGVRALVITGGPRVFAAGADVEGLAADESDLEEEGGTGDADDDEHHRHGPGSSWMDKIDSVGVPVVAAVDGFALGPGCGLALAADVVIAGQGAVFGVPEVQLGRVAAWGVTQRLTRAVGKAKAMEMVLTGRQMIAEEAESSGLVTRVAPAGEALREAVDVARVIARMSAPVALAGKRCVRAAGDMGLADGIDFEKKMGEEVRKLKDYDEGIKAFAAKREPRWKHR